MSLFAILKKSFAYSLVITAMSAFSATAQETGNTEPPAESAPAEEQSAATAEAPIVDDGVLIFGATRNTGLEVAKLLTARGDKVTAFVRESSDRSALEPLGVEFVVGDAVDAESVKAAYAGKNYSAVLSTLGCFSCEVPPDYIGNKNLTDAAKDAGSPRIILVTSLGAGDSKDAPPWISRFFLRNILPLKTQAEDHLKASGVPYTIIRPGALKDAEATGTGILTEDNMAMGVVTRADLGKLIVDCIDDESTINKVYTAKDTEMSWPWDMF